MTEAQNQPHNQPSPPPPMVTGSKRNMILMLLGTMVLLVGGWYMASRSRSHESDPPLVASGRDPLVHWEHDLQAAIDKARQTHQPIFLLATADWCPACQQFKKEVLSQPQVQQSLTSRFVCLKLDVTDPKSASTRAASELGVVSIPAMILLDENMNSLGRMVGGMSKTQLLAWVTRSLANQ